MQTPKLFFLFALLINTAICNAQNDSLQIMFYNAENLFDTINNPTTEDEEFLPDAIRKWHSGRYWKKQKKIASVIAAAKTPDIIGFCEVENESVLKDLFNKTYLSRVEYKIVHYDSPDPRGIDVALAYRPESVKIINHKALKVVFPFDTAQKTRDVLYAKFLIFSKDTLHFIVNHWPSRRGGEEGNLRRSYVAGMVKKMCDSIQNSCNNAKIVITGDFNDAPSDASIREGLKASENLSVNAQLFVLLPVYSHKSVKGSHKYEGEWSLFDQFIVSKGFLNTYSNYNSRLFDVDFLLENDKKYLGVKPYRFYNGIRFNNGYSDHLPALLNFKK